MLLLLFMVTLSVSYVLIPKPSILKGRVHTITRPSYALSAMNSSASYSPPKYRPTYHKVGYSSWRQIKARKRQKPKYDDMEMASSEGTSTSIWSNYVELVKTLAKSRLRLDYLRHFVQISNESYRVLVGEEMGSDVPRYNEIKLEQDLKQSIGEIFKPKKNKGLGA